MLKKGIDYQPLGFDCGHSFLKQVDHRGQIMIESLIGDGPLLAQTNGLFASNTSRKSVDNIHLETDFGPKLVGHLAQRSEVKPWSVTGKGKYADQEFIKTMLLAGLSEGNLNGSQVALITAVPAEWAGDKELQKIIKANLEGAFTVNRIGKKPEKTVIIAEAIVRSETDGLLFSYLLDSKGETTIDNWSDLASIVIDGGWYSTCIGVYKGLSQGETYTYTDVSMLQIHAATGRKIKVETGRHLEPWQVRDIILRGDGTIPHTVKGVLGRFDILPIYEAEIRKAQRNLFTKVNQLVESQPGIDMILLGGGSGKPLSSMVVNQYGDLVKVCDQFSTAQGLYNYGVRLCKAMANR